MMPKSSHPEVMAGGTVPSIITISAAFALHTRERLRAEKWAHKTEEAYDIACLHLINKFGDMNIFDFTYEHAVAWNEWLFSWQSQNTVKNNISCLRMVLRFLKLRKHLDVMNYEDIPVPKRAKQKIYYLTEQEVREFIYEVSRKVRGYSNISRLRNIAILEVLFATGLRNGELCALNRDTIRERSFTVVGKSKDPRPCYIDDKAEKAIANYLAERTDSNSALFVSPLSGKRMTSKALRDVFTVICNRSTKFKNVHPHTVRHSFGTYMLHKNVNLRFVGDLMGHQSLETTRIYTHYENPQLKAVYDEAHGIPLLT